MSEYQFIGKSLPRLDGASKATGKESYGVDFSLSGMLHASLLRSPYPHARILNVNKSIAEKIPGVLAVMTAAGFPAAGLVGAALDKPLLASDKVHFIGEPVAAVAALDEATAQQAIEAIEVNYEPLPAVFDMEEALLTSAPLVHEHTAPLPVADISGPGPMPPPLFQRESLNRMLKRFPGTNIAMRMDLEKGDIARGFSESDFVFEDAFHCPQQYQAYLEPHAAIASVDDSENISLWTNNSRAFPISADICRIFKIPSEKLRVICTSVGGSFGGKNWLSIEPYCIALSRRTGRPVKMALSYEEDMSTAAGSVPCVIRMKTGVKKDGTLVAKQAEMLWDAGAYGDGITTLIVSRNVSLGPYRIPHARIDTRLVFTNKMPTNPFRSFGAQYVAWANERQMDIIAGKLNIDPLQIRLKNILKDGDTTTSGDVIKGAHLEECLLEAARSIGWGKDPGRNRSLGISCFIKGSSVGTLSEVAVRVDRDGTVNAFSGNCDVGQGLKTVLAQVVGEELGISPDMVKVATSDSAVTPYDDGAYSSRSTVCMGNAALSASRKVREQLLRIASHLLEKPEVALSIKEGRVFWKDISTGLTFSRLVSEADGLIAATGSSRDPIGRQKPALSESHFGAQAAEVEVDTETGNIKVLRVVTAHDTGQAINKAGLEGQMEGGIVMGIGAALTEEKLFEQGLLLNPGLRDYRILTSLDTPQQIECITVEGKDGCGPFSSKGTGEETNIGITAAIGNAVQRATGASIKGIAISPDIVLGLSSQLKKNLKGETKHDDV